MSAVGMLVTAAAVAGTRHSNFIRLYTVHVTKLITFEYVFVTCNFKEH